MTPAGSPRPGGGPDGDGSKAPTVEPARPTRRPTVVFWVPAAAAVLAMAPLLLLLARGLASGLPDFAVDGDMAVTELAVREAAAGHRLTGPYSRFAFSHPGPLPFYLLVPGYRLAGDSFSGLLLSALLLNAFAVAASLVVVWRGAGRLAAAWAAAALALYLLYLRPELLHSVWNPNLSLLPFAVAVLATVAVGAGRAWALPIGVVAGSLALQCHVAYLLPLLTVAGVAVAVGLRPSIAGAAGPDGPGRSRWKPAWLVAAAVAVLLWAPVVVEQATGQPGNLTRLARFFASSGVGVKLPAAADVVAGTVGGTLLAPLGSNAAAPAVVPAWAAKSITLLVLAGTIGGFLRCRRRGDRFGAGLALSCLVLFVVAVLAVTRVVGAVEPYLVRWISVLAPLTLLAILIGWVRPRRRGGRSAAAWAAVVLTAAVSVANVVAAAEFASLREHAAGPRYRRIERLAAATAAGLAENGVMAPRLGVFSHAVWDTAAGVALRLLKLGHAVGIDPAWHELMGRGAARRGWRADGGLILCRPEVADGFAEGDESIRIGGDEHVAIILVRRPAAVGKVTMAEPLSVVMCSEGLYGPEAGRYRWSRGLHSTFSVPLSAGRSVDLEIEATPAGASGREQVVAVSLNGAPLGSLEMQPGQRSYRLRLPGELIGPVNDLRFDYRFFVVPGARDPRELAVRFATLRFATAPPRDAVDRPVGD